MGLYLDCNEMRIFLNAKNWIADTFNNNYEAATLSV